MSRSTSWWLAAAASLFVFVWAGSAAAATEEQRGIDPNQGKSLVEVTLASKGAATRLQLDAESYGIDFNEHYLRRNSNGTVTATVFGSTAQLDALERAGFDLGATIEGPSTWRDRAADRRTEVRQERRAEAAALDEPVSPSSHEDELVVLRVDWFENYAGRFLSVEAKTRLGGSTPTGATYTGPTLSLSYDSGPGTPIDSEPVLMDVNIDPDTSPDTYIEHRELVRVSETGSSQPRPTRIRIGSSTGSTIEAPVDVWLGGGLPPMTDGYLKDFTTRYMDPTEVYTRFDELAAEFSNIAELITLPHKTNGYQRRAQALMAGATPTGDALSNSTTNPAAILARSRAVVLTSRAWGHEGGNQIRAEFVNSGANEPLTVSAAGSDITVRLATNATGEITSTAAQVVQAINASPQASPLLVARTYRGNAGDGVVEPRALVNLSDFLDEGTSAHVQRGPFEYSVMRITGDDRRGRGRDKEEKVGVFLYCQQHAREWATPLTCLETAEQLLRNYALDERTRSLVDNLEIYILPSSNPDGGHYSMHNFNMQRRNLTNHCVVGGKETDDPFAANFWTPRINPAPATTPGGQLPYTNTDPGSRDQWGVDLNRNNTFGTLFDGYIGASHSCNSDVYTGPDEASEPEIKNELWIADTFDNIKFSNNIHSFGGYFMWAPGTYLPDRGEGDAVHANIGIEKYFFEAGDRILNRIKEVRNTAILPERTGPIADVLYSAGGNSADEHWYNRDVIAYSFETGADRFADTELTADAPAGQAGVRVANRAGIDIGDRLTIGKGTPQQETGIVDRVLSQNPSSPQPNVLLTAPLANSHEDDAVVAGPTIQQGVGFQPDYDTEGKFEALEFARGNVGLLESALDYARDDERPRVRMTGPHRSRTPVETTFEWVNEPSVIRYTTDGSKPRASSRLWDSTGPREPGETFHIRRTTTFRWIAEDIKGNVSTGKQKFVIGRGGDDDSDSDR